MADLNHPFEALADLPGASFAAVRLMIMAQAKSSGLTVFEDAHQALTIGTPQGLVGLRSGTTCDVAVIVSAHDNRALFSLEGAVVAQISQVMPDVANTLRWSDNTAQRTLPPNFQFMRATRVEAIGSAFLRVTLAGDDVSAHQDKSIHFRLVLPPEGQIPTWPSVAPNGSIAWPDGEMALHRPVYTARAVDHDNHTIEVDVFVHEGGRVTQWARGLEVGDLERSVIGLVGPSGGGLLDADHVLMASDETGFPAVARLLEGLPASATGTLLLEAEHGAACQYPLPANHGLSVHWLARKRGERLCEATLSSLGAHADAALWFAGERADAKRVRDRAKELGVPQDRLRVSGFWRAPDESVAAAE
ncbi:MAG: siderophore-interacting protein [Pseudomonadota bacterium]